MTLRATLQANDRGTAAAELAMVAPLLLLILFGASELGLYFYNQHILVKSVRDGAVFAARQPIDRFDCTGTPPIDPALVTTTRTLVRTGELGGSTNLLPQWSKTDATFTMTVECVTAAGGTTLGGIYSANGGNVPKLTVSATLPYLPMTGFLATTFVGAKLRATQEAAVVGL